MIEKNIYDFARVIIGSPAARCGALIRLMNACRESGLIKLAKLCSNRLNARGIYISHHAKIDSTVKFLHPTAVVIGEGVVVRQGVRIYQNVTLGGARVGDGKVGGYPSVGERTVIFAGAVIVGNITIGKNSIIGANSVVLTDVPDNAVYVGAPARNIAEKS